MEIVSKTLVIHINLCKSSGINKYMRLSRDQHGVELNLSERNDSTVRHG